MAVALLVILPSVPCRAQPKRTAGFEPSAVAITGATIVPAPGQRIPGATLVMRDGLIVGLGPGADVPADAETIDGQGLFVYAGFIDAGAADLLDENSKPEPAAGREVDFSRYALAATRPDNRRGLTPEFRAAENLGRDAGTLDSLRKAGFTAVHVVPTGRSSAGQSALLDTSGAPPRESVLSETTFTAFRLFAPRGNSYPATLMGVTAHLRQAFLDAGRHRLHRRLFADGAPDVQRPPIDPALEALGRVLSGEDRALFLTDSRDDIHRALDFAAEFSFPVTLWGCPEAWRAVDRLKRDNVKVVVQVDFGDEPKVEPAGSKLPASEPGKHTVEMKPPARVQRDRLKRWKRRVAGLAELQRAGIRFAITSRGLKNRKELLQNLRLAIEAGLPREAALAALTSDAADVLGIDDRLGTLGAGKLAHIVVMTGPFDHEESKVRYVFVGRTKSEYNQDAEPLPTSEDGTEGQKPDGNLSGRWQVTIDSAGGPLSADLQLIQKGKQLSGTFGSKQGDGEIASGTVKDESLEFLVRLDPDAGAIELKFSGRQAEDGLRGRLRPPFGAVTEWSAERTRSGSAGPSASPEAAGALVEKPVSAPVPDRQPVELDSDRLARPVQTGGNVLVAGATVLTGTGRTLPDTSVLVEDGTIAAIGKDLQPPEGVTVIDAGGRYVMPGIIDTHSHIMISGGVNESTQSIVPEVRIKDVVDTDDVAEYRALAGGTTTARLLHGSANVIGGQDAVVKLKYGATAAEHILHDAPQGVKFALGENVKYRRGRFPDTRLGVEATLNRAFLEAIDYRRRWSQYKNRPSEAGNAETRTLPPRRDLRLEALADIVNHKKFIHSHCYRADEILMLLRVAEDLGIRVWSLQHVLEGYKIAPEIVRHGASCSTFADWWAYKVEAYDAVPHNAALLNEAGANAVIKSDNAELIRHLYLEAAKTVRYGNMPPQDALQTITINAARELGLDDRIGSIEVGKDGDLAIFNGHPLNAFSRCEMTLIEGEVYFSREHAPTAMSAEAEQRSAQPRPVKLSPRETRERPLPLAESPDGRYAIVGATLHPVDQENIPNGTILIVDGRIAALGSDVAVPGDVEVIDAAGLHVFPGLIDAGTTLGLTEIGKVRETHDYAESGQFQPDLRAGIALNVDSELIAVARAGGITTTLIRPTGGVICGQASVGKLAGWTAAEMILDYQAGLQIDWTSNEERIQQLHEFLDEARLYQELKDRAEKQGRPGPIADPRMEALGPYLEGRKPVFIEADSRKAIAEALQFAEREKLRPIITGGTQAWLLAEELKERNVPVIVGPVMRRPVDEYDPFDAPYANPGRLWEAGVQFCIRSDSASNSRNAPFEAAMAVAYGLPEKEAVRAVTLSAAEILGIDGEVGSLRPGKLANLVISDGSLLQQTSQIKGIFIEGQPFAPESRQTRFYERYRRRLHEWKKNNEPTAAAGQEQ